MCTEPLPRQGIWRHAANTTYADAGAGMGDAFRTFHLDGKAVTVWRLLLDEPSSDFDAAAWGLLDHAERARADRFQTQTLRARFVAAHAKMRWILGGLLSIPPDAICLITGSQGKPRIISSQNAKGLQFNLSHSGKTALLAVTTGGGVGVDLESPSNPVFESDALLAVFSQREQVEIQRLQPAIRAKVVCRLWTRKEACVKALGTGIGDAFASLSFHSGLADEKRCKHVVQDHPDFLLCDMDLGSHIGALALHPRYGNDFN